MRITINTTPIEEIEDPIFDKAGVRLLIKRDDLIHPTVSGNKWRKLKYNLSEAQNLGYDKLLTFGGAYSNHIYATAAAGRLFGFDTIGVIRGEKTEPINSTLDFALQNGMKLHYMDREKYRNKMDKAVLMELQERFGKFYLIPEGGSNSFAIRGMCEVFDEVHTDFDYACCPCGTGGTLAGLIAGLNRHHKALGFSVLKGGSFLIDDVTDLLKEYNGLRYDNWEIMLDYHFGGYAKAEPELLKFLKRFERSTKVPTEFIYTGKMFFGIYDLIQKGYFQKGTTILALHTGGIR